MPTMPAVGKYEVRTSAKAESASRDNNESAITVIDVEAYALQNSAIESDAKQTDHNDEEEMLLDDAQKDSATQKKKQSFEVHLQSGFT
uniref:Uncharacterized protein n=1 Tax=Romanomermis culicivorax TaxID=13658 RepID=A0A915KJ51_ROMCU